MRWATPTQVLLPTTVDAYLSGPILAKAAPPLWRMAPFRLGVSLGHGVRNALGLTPSLRLQWGLPHAHAQAHAQRC